MARAPVKFPNQERATTSDWSTSNSPFLIVDGKHNRTYSIILHMGNDSLLPRQKWNCLERRLSDVRLCVHEGFR